jgi:hypothetical protein
LLCTVTAITVLRIDGIEGKAPQTQPSLRPVRDYTRQHCTPYTLHPTHHNLHPAPDTPHCTPYTLHPTPYIINTPRKIRAQAPNRLVAHSLARPPVPAFRLGVRG